ncbi:leucine-rich repeat flightless-interacting protein 1-like isoform X4 [Sphaerodactylus townsendi]|uniref:leucine-rich repeat flightless-interacting protein 1-like isoform X4 n=1 Tax=Sphaerodactylus townsendi TaxID=933632 RepID=UPI002026FB69|nr:leucine-rich repeat flightless-interacting protein 1-like isoform X4 [Sphaerodactylus townsendi]
MLILGRPVAKSSGIHEDLCFAAAHRMHHWLWLRRLWTHTCFTVSRRFRFTSVCTIHPDPTVTQLHRGGAWKRPRRRFESAPGSSGVRVEAPPHEAPLPGGPRAAHCAPPSKGCCGVKMNGGSEESQDPRSAAGPAQGEAAQNGAPGALPSVSSARPRMRASSRVPSLRPRGVSEPPPPPPPNSGAMELAGPPPQGPPGRKRLPNRDRPAAEDDALHQIARQAEARLAAKRAARAEAREIRMKELERQQKEIYQVQKKYCGLDAKFGDIEQWMEDTERYNRKSRRYTSVSDEDERMSVGSRGSLRPSEYSYYLGSGSRASSRASSARASPVVEERTDKEFERGARTVSSLSAATLASLGGTSSRRGSGDTSLSVDTEASIREIKDSLAEVEEKYKKAMVSNAQLDNEKTNFMYQVDVLKDALLELEEQLAESRRQYEEKNKDFEKEKHAYSILQFQFMEVKEVLKQREELLAEIQQLQQKQEGYSREISDLQETIEWKERKIGALERQKEFFDSIRSERDGLREEVNMLKEQLKKNGIFPYSEVATNGETCGDSLLSSSAIVPVTSHAIKVAEDGILGRAIEMEMKNESVENVRKREILQNTEHEELTEENKEMEIVQECLDTKTLPIDGNMEAEKMTEGQVISAPSLNSGLEESAKTISVHVPRIVCDLKNSDVSALRDKCGLLGHITELKEVNEDGGLVNEIDNQNNVVDPCIDTNQEINTVSEIFSQQQQTKGNQKYILVDEAGANNNEVFEETLDFMAKNHTATSSQSEPLNLAEDTLTEGARRDSSAEHPCFARESLENKVAESISESQGAEGGLTGKKHPEKTKETHETENAVLLQETEVLMSAVEKGEALGPSGNALVQEDKQVELQGVQSMPLQHDVLAEQEQKERETRESANDIGKCHTEKTKQREALLGALDADSEKNSEQHIVKEVLSERTVACQVHGERMLENDSRNCMEIDSEFIPDGKTLAHISASHEELAQEDHKEDNSTQVKYESTGEESAEEEVVEIIQEPAVTAVTMDIEKAAKGDGEDGNLSKAEEVLAVAPEIRDTPCLESQQKADFSGQEEEPDSEGEEAGEEYHEAIDFDGAPGEFISEWNVGQGNEEEENKQTEDEGGAARGAVQNMLQEHGHHEHEGAQEGHREQTNQSSVNKVRNEGALTGGDENLQPENQKESEKAEHLHVGSSDSVSAEALHETEMSKKGKGKSREDCAVS